VGAESIYRPCQEVKNFKQVGSSFASASLFILSLFSFSAVFLTFLDPRKFGAVANQGWEVRVILICVGIIFANLAFRFQKRCGD
jgi:hypothetical protein